MRRGLRLLVPHGTARARASSAAKLLVGPSGAPIPAKLCEANPARASHVGDLPLHKRTAALNRGSREMERWTKCELAITGRRLLGKVRQREGIGQSQHCTRYRSLAGILTLPGTAQEQ
ncbi:hypothetical protein BHM03_00030750 [Ensete ventricosum]|uniref:Uncharacterized protein n=1 Tax=Ensete ventricosum TaxID=4639 RepID=A0A445MIE1_ENSVE|nr:hypothetical protein BHM03_00030750 [Ensete ventricosum]